MRASVFLILAACGGEAAGPIPLDTLPCESPTWWPGSLSSPTIPLELHTPAGFDEARAADILAILERAWTIEIDDMRFREPLRGADCGRDDAIDVFLWPGQPEAYVDALAPDDTTPQDDWFTYLVVDPDGEYGGAQLPATLAHELNHMSQAADDWNEPIGLMEATATYVEAQLEPALGARALTVADFQAHPEWSPDHDDGYETWFMYGASLYLEVLRAVRFDSHTAALGDLWLQMRNTADSNEPDWADAVRLAIAPAPLDDTLVDLAIWRWYVASHADDRHLPGAADLPPPALAGTATSSTTTLPLGTLDALGSAYVDLPAGITTVTVTGLPPELSVRLLALPGTDGADADELPVTAATATLDSPTPRTLVVIVVPLSYDPDTRPAPVALTLSLEHPTS
jgi:hypothetical protein